MHTLRGIFHRLPKSRKKVKTFFKKALTFFQRGVAKFKKGLMFFQRGVAKFFATFLRVARGMSLCPLGAGGNDRTAGIKKE
jgi:hypothetical protein